MKPPETTWSSVASWTVEKTKCSCTRMWAPIPLDRDPEQVRRHTNFLKMPDDFMVKKLVENGWFYIVLDVKLVSNTQSPEKFYPSFKLSKIQVFVKWCRCNDFNEKQRIIWNFVSEYLSKQLVTFLECSSDRTFLSNLLHQQMLKTMKYIVLLAYW